MFWRDEADIWNYHRPQEGFSVITWIERRNRFTSARSALADVPAIRAKAQHLKTMEWLEERKVQIREALEEMKRLSSLLPAQQALRLSTQTAFFEAEDELKEAKEQIMAHLSRNKKPSAFAATQGNESTGHCFTFSP
jgi:hypothetical protein